MARYFIPHNTGKVRVAKFLGGKWVVWNGKTDAAHEFRIFVKDRKQGEAVAKIVNQKLHNGEIEVLG